MLYSYPLTVSSILKGHGVKVIRTICKASYQDIKEFHKRYADKEESDPYAFFFLERDWFKVRNIEVSLEIEIYRKYSLIAWILFFAEHFTYWLTGIYWEKRGMEIFSL